MRRKQTSRASEAESTRGSRPIQRREAIWRARRVRDSKKFMRRVVGWSGGRVAGTSDDYLTTRPLDYWTIRPCPTRAQAAPSARTFRTALAGSRRREGLYP